MTPYDITMRQDIPSTKVVQILWHPMALPWDKTFPQLCPNSMTPYDITMRQDIPSTEVEQILWHHMALPWANWLLIIICGQPVNSLRTAHNGCHFQNKFFYDNLWWNTYAFHMLRVTLVRNLSTTVLVAYTWCQCTQKQLPKPMMT